MHYGIYGERGGGRNPVPFHPVPPRRAGEGRHIRAGRAYRSRCLDAITPRIAMKIAKRFRWEAAHRLPWHEGLCRHLHGHSYRMVVELEGTPDDRGMLLDFKHLKRALQPLVEAWDHATLIAETDTALLELLQQTDWKHVVLPFDTTAENLSAYVADYLCETMPDLLRAHRVHTVRVRLAETETCYAEAERAVSAEVAAPAMPAAATHEA